MNFPISLMEFYAVWEATEYIGNVCSDICKFCFKKLSKKYKKDITLEELQRYNAHMKNFGYFSGWAIWLYIANKINYVII